MPAVRRACFRKVSTAARKSDEVVPRHHVSCGGDVLDPDVGPQRGEFTGGGVRDDRALGATYQQGRRTELGEDLMEVFGLEPFVGLHHSGLVATGQVLRADLELPFGPAQVEPADCVDVGYALRLVELREELLAGGGVRRAARAGQRWVHQNDGPAVGASQAQRPDDPRAHRVADERRPAQAEGTDHPLGVGGVVSKGVATGARGVAAAAAPDVGHSDPVAGGSKIRSDEVGRDGRARDPGHQIEIRCSVLVVEEHLMTNPIGVHCGTTAGDRRADHDDTSVLSVGIWSMAQGSRARAGSRARSSRIRSTL